MLSLHAASHRKLFDGFAPALFATLDAFIFPRLACMKT